MNQFDRIIDRAMAMLNDYEDKATQFHPFFQTQIDLEGVSVVDVQRLVHNWIIGRGSKRRARKMLKVPAELQALNESWHWTKIPSRLENIPSKARSEAHHKMILRAARNISVCQILGDTAKDGYSVLFAFSHRDPKTKGRYTHHIISINQAQDYVEVQLYSAQVVEWEVPLSQNLEPPSLVEMLLSMPRAKVLSTPSVEVLTEQDVESFIKDNVMEDSRRLPILVCSTKQGSGIHLKSLMKMLNHQVDVVLLSTPEVASAWAQSAQDKGIGAWECLQGNCAVYLPPSQQTILGSTFKAQDIKGDDDLARARSLARQTNSYCVSRSANPGMWPKAWIPWNNQISRYMEDTKRQLEELQRLEELPVPYISSGLDDKEISEVQQTDESFVGKESLRVATKFYAIQYIKYQVDPKRFEEIISIYQRWVNGNIQRDHSKRAKTDVTKTIDFSNDVNIETEEVRLHTRADDERWILEYEESDDSEKNRTWVTRVRLTKDSDGGALLEHGLEQRLRAKARPANVGNTPRVIAQLAKAGCFEGHTPSKLVRLTQDKVVNYVSQTFREKSEDVSTLVLTPHNDSRLDVDIDELRKKLDGQVSIVYLEDAAAASRWRIELCRDYQEHNATCSPGQVRLYYSKSLGKTNLENVEKWRTDDFERSKDPLHAARWLSNRITHLLALRSTPADLRMAVESFDEQRERVQRRQQRKFKRESLQKSRPVAISIPEPTPDVDVTDMPVVVTPQDKPESPESHGPPTALKTVASESPQMPAVPSSMGVSLDLDELADRVAARLATSMQTLHTSSLGPILQKLEQIQAVAHAEASSEASAQIDVMLDQMQSQLNELQQGQKHQDQSIETIGQQLQTSAGQAQAQALSTTNAMHGLQSTLANRLERHGFEGPNQSDDSLVESLQSRVEQLEEKLEEESFHLISLIGQYENSLENNDLEIERLEAKLISEKKDSEENVRLIEIYEDQATDLKAQMTKITDELNESKQKYLELKQKYLAQTDHVQSLKERSFEPVTSPLFEPLVKVYTGTSDASLRLVLQTLTQIYEQEDVPECAQSFVMGLRERNHDFCLENALELIELFWPQRIEVLETAWDSAREANDFEEPFKAFDLLHTLYTSYWEDIHSRGEGAAKAHFTDTTFAANESKQNRKGEALRLRTFLYDGKPRKFLPHLKIGVGSNTNDGWRCHFYYDSERRKIVIGHCGKHLNHN